MDAVDLARGPVVRAARVPVELAPPSGFRPDQLETWPSIDGRLEYVEGKLVYMPPCGADQAETVVDVVVVLAAWQRRHPEFVVRTNEAGMLLGGAIRAADVAVWRRADLGTADRGLARAAPVLAVEVTGRADDRDYLEAKVRWYLEMGVAVVWVVMPDAREVRVITRDGERVLGPGSVVPPSPALPDLAVDTSALFVQLAAATREHGH